MPILYSDTLRSNSLNCPNFVETLFLVQFLDESCEIFTGGTPNSKNSLVIELIEAHGLETFSHFF